MEISRDMVKESAKKRLAKMGLNKVFPLSRELDNNSIWLSEYNGKLKAGILFQSDELKEIEKDYDFTNLIEKVEEQTKDNSGVVYHIIISFTELGRLADILYLTDEDLDDDGHDDFQIEEFNGNKYWRLYTYNYNLDTKESEYGTIGVQNRGGGLVRIY